ncbi:MAG: 50S ribosomal protein L15 [Candidatus Magasanikbacteria bacterium CG10_big_fil_rev_8_21_14_0_10_43_6]|uniref:Large ribosomal subunit protein uL15 n=1 Tax=Candidatus Magasanikbacteria bacterium CG10_big_fil_rev_8_21_14_0_10_43_6 TaxID=1974650 RepID=A0A2M6W035_9BACT|nr:MAG: 50S ribosomal protein L15 [Candidatus Magasanikbacteria bacterium CG10_big_fil_rev_8_21_14_0_10_43_6]
MAITAHTIQSSTTANRSKKRVGRGNGSGKGTYASRGLKGQRSRSDGKGGLKRRGFKASLLKVPKLRGFKSLQKKREVITLAVLNRICANGDIVTPTYLKTKGVVDKPEFGIKLIASGTLEKNITLRGCIASKMAMEAIEKAGGTLEF